MENKENVIKNSLKRRSVTLNENSIEIKRKSILDNQLKIENNIVINNVENYQDTHSQHFENNLISELSEPFKIAFTINTNKTPIKQILSLSDFKKLPKPKYIEPQEELKIEQAVLERCQSESQNSSMNDSFEIVKPNLSRSQTYTPIFVNNTPETPCDLHNIDLDDMNYIKFLGRDSLCEYEDVKFTMPSHLALKNIHISPIFYETEGKVSTRKSEITTRHPEQYLSGKYDHDDQNIDEINVDMVSQIIDNDFTCHSYVYHIIDCRYPYEYDGGHINGAVNLYTPYQMLSYIFLSKFKMEDLRKPLTNAEESLAQVMKDILSFERARNHWKDNAYIFHCEFSSIRGPELARCLRNMDRLANWANYPKLYFPKVYIMSKGYKEFYSKYKHLCKPCHYVTMDIVDPSREKGECMTGESDDEDEFNMSVDLINNDTVKERLKIYNSCKRETQEQMRLFSQLINMEVS